VLLEPQVLLEQLAPEQLAPQVLLEPQVLLDQLALELLELLDLRVLLVPTPLVPQLVLVPRLVPVLLLEHLEPLWLT